MKTILSLGAGVQSSVLLLMSIRGELPRLDAAIFADTGWESKATYDHLEWLIGQARDIVPVHVVSAGNLREHIINTWGKTGMQRSGLPLFIKNSPISRGKLNRQCTHDFKVEPIARWMKAYIEHKPGSRLPKEPVVEQWRGITADEAHRMKPAPEPWYSVAYPFCDMTPPWTRDDCLSWLSANYPDRVVPRSACIGCPFHSNTEWRRVQAEPDEWKDAVEFDRFISQTPGHFVGQPFLHRSCKPLDEVDLRTDAECGQLDLWGNECEGMCGL